MAAIDVGVENTTTITEAEIEKMRADFQAKIAALNAQQKQVISQAETQMTKLKETADRDLTVGGARLAAQAIAAGLVDEYQLFVVPAVVGGGTRALPDQVRLNLALAQEHRFGSGTVYLCYRPA